MLLGRIVVRPAASDDDEASLIGIDTLLDTGVPVAKVIVDRGISYKSDDRWASQLRDRGIEQVIDVHAAEHGRLDYGGIAMIDGTPHCPSIPETLIEIKRPARLSTPDEKPDTELNEFRNQIDQRGRYAMRRTQGFKAKVRTGQHAERYECPAEAGYMRCPLKPASMAYPDDVPLNMNPPDATTAPAMCRQCTIELPEQAQGKLRQRNRWGTDEWITEYNRRTYVEGTFGVLRNPALGGLTRGLFCVTGLQKVTLWLAALVAATNMGTLAKWAERTGLLSSDPALVIATDDDWAFEELHAERTTGTDPPGQPAPY